MSIRITKMQGCGNDFVILDYDEFKKMNCEMSEAAKKLCNRNFGIGADGLIIPNTEVKDSDIGWFFYNSDGTTAQMCGNGMRCFAKYVYDKKLVDKKEINDEVVDKYTPSGMKKASDDGVQYACYVPKNWVTDLSDKMTYAYYPESGKPNVTVTSYSPSVEMTAEQYFSDCEMEYKKTLNGYERTEEPEKRTVGGRNAFSYQYTVKYGESVYKIMQTVLMYNGLAYSITYTARAESYDAHLEDVKTILDNFRFR